jgi:hypothetical protein
MKSKKQIMLDMETVGTAANSVILSIGAIYFNDDGSTGKEFYSLLDTISQLDKGRVEDESTVDWWEKQSDEAKKEAYSVPEEDRPDTLQVLKSLHDFIKEGGKDVLIWGNGSDFDNALLADLFRSFGMKQPWAFWNNRCFRTFKSEFKALANEPVFEGIKHHALYDAKHQVRWLAKLKAALFPGDKPVAKLEPEFTFGKYKGQLVKDVKAADPDYIRWVKENLEPDRLKLLGL